MKTIFTMMKKTELRFLGFFVFFLLASIIVVAATVYTNLFEGRIAEVALLGEVSVLIQFLLLVSGLLVVRAIFSGLTVLFQNRFMAKGQYNLRAHFIDHFLRAPFGNVEETGSGEILSVYTNDISGAVGLAVHDIPRVLDGFVMFIASSTFLLMISPFYTGILVFAFVVLMLFVLLIIQPMTYFQKKASEETAKFNAVVNDSLQNLPVVAAYSLDDVVEERYMTAYSRFMAYIRKMAFTSIALVAVAFLALFGPMAVINVIMAFGVIDGAMSIPEFIAYMATIMMVIQGLSNLMNSVGAIASNLARAKRVLENTASVPEEVSDGETLDVNVSLDISFEDVSFAYRVAEDKVSAKNTPSKKKKSDTKTNVDALPDDEKDSEASPVEESLALDTISFDIKAGSRVAFVGGSGSGKSTVLKLLLGLYEPTGGKITVGGKDASTLSKHSLRAVSAYVPQDSFLFPESIGENITLEKELTDLTRLEKACEEAEILDFIHSLPAGFDSILAESSENISGGQRQRIALARAFYKDAPIILFDEATSSLDPNTEAEIIDSLDIAATGKTLIMVAHRAKAISLCDTIVVMEAGKMVGIGTHDELIQSNLTYQSLEVGHHA